MKKHKNIISILMTWVFLFTQSAFAVNFTDDSLQLGKPGSSANKQIKFGAGTGNKPQIRYNPSTLTLEFSNDGVDFTDIGSGSGGSGGVQMLLNPEFEKTPATNNWTASAGTTATITSGGNLGFDKKSVSWTPNAGADTFSSDAITIVSGLLGARGEASIYYKSASATHKLQVYDGSTVLSEKTLIAASNYRKERIEFSIPTSGSIRLRILAGDNTIVYLDKAYMGPVISPSPEDLFDIQKNFVIDPKAENGGQGFVVYKDAAGTSPVDGTGQISAPALTCGTTTSTPLEGGKSYLITKPASNVQGEGCSMQLSPLGEPEKAKVLQVSFDYKVASGTYTDDHLKIYAYDIDNSELKELATTFVKKSSLAEKYKGVFQTTLTGSNYRLIFHWAGTDAVANSIKLDNLRVSSQVFASGSFATDWQNFTPTGAWTVNTTWTGRYRYVGDSAEIQAAATLTGAPNVAGFNMSVASVCPVDATKLAASNLPALGSAQLIDNGVSGRTATVSWEGGNSVRVYSADASADNWVSNAIPFAFNSGDNVTLNFTIPCSGRTSNTFLASEYQTRIVGVKAYSAAGGQTMNNASTVTIDFDTVEGEDVGGFDLINNRYVFKRGGVHNVICQYGLLAASTNRIQSNIRVNGSTFIGSALVPGTPTGNSTVQSNSGPYRFKAGDYVECLGMQETGVSRTTLAGREFTYMTVHNLGGAPEIGAAQTVAGFWKTAAGQAVVSGGTKIIYGTVDNETHPGAMNLSTGDFSAPMPGLYFISASSGAGSGNNQDINIFCNGVQKSNGRGYSSVIPVVKATALCFLLTGQIVYVNSSLFTGNLSIDAAQNNISIMRIGN